eukprot:1787849-Amphidinium_carterae.1
MACPIENRAPSMLIQRKIQNNDVRGGASLGLAHVPPREHSNRKRTSYLFHMVAELAIELVRICVTRASQLFYTLAWLC